MRSLSALVAVALAGCGSSSSSCHTPVAMTLVQSQVFDGCSTGAGSGCHTATPFGANLDLSRGMAWGNLLHAPSNSSPGKFRVEPGDLDNSFLWQKLNDSIASDGTEGVPMPRSASDKWARLSDAQLAAVRCWIASGASD
jgi:hypothetical protein